MNNPYLLLLLLTLNILQTYCNTTNPEFCPSGQIADLETKTCKACSLGTYEVDRIYCKECPPGTQSSLEGASSADSCVPCQVGHVSPDFASPRCTECAGGYFEHEKTICKPCAPSTFSAEAQGACQACEAGSVSGAASSSCNKCTDGTYEVDRVACALCPLGQIAKAGKGCEPCAAGSMRNDLLFTSCLRCEFGYYEEDRLRCLSCPEGKTSIKGASGADSCKSAEEVETMLVSGAFANSFDDMIEGISDSTKYEFTVYYRNTTAIRGLEEILTDKNKAEAIRSKGMELYLNWRSQTFSFFKFGGQHGDQPNIVKSVVVLNHYLLYTFQTMDIEDTKEGVTNTVDLKVIYRYSDQDIGLSLYSSIPSNKQEECAICSTEYEDGEEVVQLGCNPK